jgi:folate-binding protein YgfZ
MSGSGSNFCSLTQFGLIRFSGEDAQSFLHNQLSCDVAALAPNHSTYGAYCTPKGRMLASFLLWRSDQGYFMQLPSSLREPLQKQLSKFILRSKVKAADASGDWTLIGVAGKESAALMQRVIGQAPQGERGVAHTPDATVIRLPGDRFEIAATKDKAPRVLEALAAGAEKAGQDYWEWLDIQSGIPTILPATQEAFVPQMVNLDLIGGVSFEKGCYPGQEIVARMHYRGTLKQRMYLAGIASNEQPQPGEKLFSAAFGEQACGTIVNSAPSPQGGYDALAVIQIAAVEKGGVHWRSLEGPLLKLLPLPYSVNLST